MMTTRPAVDRQLPALTPAAAAAALRVLLLLPLLLGTVATAVVVCLAPEVLQRGRPLPATTARWPPTLATTGGRPLRGRGTHGSGGQRCGGWSSTASQPATATTHHTLDLAAVASDLLQAAVVIATVVVTPPPRLPACQPMMWRRRKTSCPCKHLRGGRGEGRGGSRPRVTVKSLTIGTPAPSWQG
eukprot:COSAG01_NODE_9557_length_2410_cov_1.923410_2_plen_186_part_00